MSSFYAKHVAYALIMATRPQTLYGLADSPVDLAAFMLDHGDGTGQPGLVEQTLNGGKDGNLTRDDILDNITLYWLTNTGVSSARLYWENKADFFDAKPITIPFAISVFPDELYQAPRELGRARLPPQPHPLQPARPGWPLRCLGTAAALLGRDESRLPFPAQITKRSGSDDPTQLPIAQSGWFCQVLIEEAPGQVREFGSAIYGLVRSRSTLTCRRSAK